MNTLNSSVMLMTQKGTSTMPATFRELEEYQKIQAKLEKMKAYKSLFDKLKAIEAKMTPLQKQLVQETAPDEAKAHEVIRQYLCEHVFSKGKKKNGEYLTISGPVQIDQTKRATFVGIINNENADDGDSFEWKDADGELQTGLPRGQKISSQDISSTLRVLCQLDKNKTGEKKHARWVATPKLWEPLDTTGGGHWGTVKDADADDDEDQEDEE